MRLIWASNWGSSCAATPALNSGLADARRAAALTLSRHQFVTNSGRTAAVANFAAELTMYRYLLLLGLFLLLPGAARVGPAVAELAGQYRAAGSGMVVAIDR